MRPLLRPPTAAALLAAIAAGCSDRPPPAAPGVPLEFAAPVLPDGGVGAPWSYRLAASGGQGRQVWRAAGLPAGVELDSLSGELAGVPATAGTHDLVLTVHRGPEHVTRTASWTVHDALDVITRSLPEGRVGRAWTHRLEAAGGHGPVAWSVVSGALPPGVALDRDGSLAGTPLEATPDEGAPLEFAVTNDLGQRANASLAFIVRRAGLTLTAAEPVRGRVGEGYAHRLQVEGAAGPVRWTATTELPPGLVLTEDGELIGTPEREGLWATGFRATDGPDTLAVTLALRVCDRPEILTAGASVAVRFPDPCGLAVQGGVGRYRVTILPRRATGSAVIVAGGLSLRLGGGGVAASPAVDAPAPPRETVSPDDRALAESTEAAHARLRAAELEREAGRTRGLRVSASAGPAAAPAGADPGPARRRFWVLDPAGGPRTSIEATLRWVSPSVVYYEDDGVGAAGTRASDAEIERLLDYYERFGRPVVDRAFGGLGPVGITHDFATDGVPRPRLAADLDANGGRFVVLQLRPSLMLAGTAAFVDDCDRYPRPENAVGDAPWCRESNEAEITYMARPATDFFLGSLVHEAKHLSSHGWAVFGGRGLNPSWIEEGTAEIAKEKSSRWARGFADGIRLGVADVFPGGVLPAEAYGMALVHTRARSFLRASPVASLVGNPRPNPEGSTYYGASWLFHRWLADVHGGADENDFFLRLNTQGRGTEVIERVSGRSFPDLLEDWADDVGREGTETPGGFRSYDFAALADGTWTSPWPFARSATHWPVAYLTAPIFVDVQPGGGGPLELDLEGADGRAVAPGDDVVVRVRRLR